jgi:hypothetical protein
MPKQQAPQVRAFGTFDHGSCEFDFIHAGKIRLGA